MAGDKDRENPEERHSIFEPASSRCEDRLLSVFTTSEKQHLVARAFSDWDLNHVDFSSADLRWTRFVNMSLQGCDFSKADLRGAAFIGCDLRRANFESAIFGYNRFEKSCLINATGISKRRRSYITAQGGSFWYC
jgi:uncharacterized protein YjbI with pentapeptide repeats